MIDKYFTHINPILEEKSYSYNPTEPKDDVENYQLGLRLRAQAIRDFLFFELEPTLNQRIDSPTAAREATWAIEARIELMLFD